MNIFEILAERKIREAMEEGEFDNLSGKGEPLDLSENPYEDPASRMAHRLLRNSGHSLPWIEESRDIVRSIDGARAALRAAPASPSAIACFRLRAAEINRRILDFNVRAPARGVELRTLSVEDEIAAASESGTS
jgi:DnaJ homolog subfamily C member 28